MMEERDFQEGVASESTRHRGMALSGVLVKLEAVLHSRRITFKEGAREGEAWSEMPTSHTRCFRIYSETCQEMINRLRQNRRKISILCDRAEARI